MILGLIVFVLGKPLLMGRGESPFPQRLKQVRVGLPTEWLIYIGAVLSVLGVWQLIQYQAIVGWLLGASGLALASYVVVTSMVTLKSEDRDRIFVAMFLMGASILFWALFEQAGSSLNVFTDRRVDRNMFGFEVPASTFQSINAIYIVLLAPVFAGLWTFLGARKLEPSTPAKFGLAMVQLGAGFLVLVAGAAAAGNGLTPVLFIFAIYLLHTTGELCLSPVGLSAMTKLALPHMVGLIMGTWFFASALGNFTAGLIAQATGGEGVKKDAVTVEVIKDVATEAFVFKAILKEPVEGGFTVDYKIIAVKPESEPVATPDAVEGTKAVEKGESAKGESAKGESAKGDEKAEEPKNTLPAGTIAFEGTAGEVEEVTVAIPADANLAEGEKLGVELGEPTLSAERVLQVYSTVGWSALIVGLLIVIISPFFKRLMHLESLHQSA
jgi:dipeptide/tripeptide permease